MNNGLNKEKLLNKIKDLKRQVARLEEAKTEIVLRERKTRERMEFAENLLAASLIPLIVMDPKDGTYIDCNMAAVQIYGYQHKREVLGKTPLDVSAPTQYGGEDSVIEAGTHTKICLEEGFHAFEWRHQNPDGKIWDAHVHLMLFHHRGRPLIQFVVQDITKHKQVAAALRESEEAIRSLINATSEILLLIDRNGKILVANETGAARLGKTVDEIIGVSQYDLFSRDVAIERRERYERVSRTGNPVHFEDKIFSRHYSTHAYPVFNNSGAVTKLAIFAVDITEQKKLEENLIESEGKFRSLAEKSMAGIYLLQDGIFQYVNAKLAEMLGYTIEEIVGKKGPDVFVHPEDFPLVEKNMERRLSGEIESLNSEFRLVIKDTSVREVEIFSSLTTYHGRPAIIGTMLDMTQRKRAEEDREKLIAELKDALSKVKILSGLLPICSSCKKVRNDKGYWEQIEIYIRDHSEADFSHGICPDCARKLYPEIFKNTKS